MVRLNPKTAGFVCAAAVALGMIFVWLTGSYLTRPVNHPVGALPNGLTGRNVEFRSASGGMIRGWLIPGRKGAGAIALMHGYRGDRTQMPRTSMFTKLRRRNTSGACWDSFIRSWRPR